MLKYAVCLGKGCSDFCLYCEAWICIWSCMGSMSVWSCRCMGVFCVHPVAVLNAAFCMTCSLLMLVEDARDDHMGGYKQHRLQAVELSQTAVQIVSNPPAPSNGCPIYRFWASQPCGPAGWLALLITKAGDVETNSGPTTLNWVDNNKNLPVV